MFLDSTSPTSEAITLKNINFVLGGWIKMLDTRGKENEGHMQRVTDITMRMAIAVGIKDDKLVHIRRGALLHDIGKLWIPDEILHKPGPLTADEWTTMKKHPVYAHEWLNKIELLRPALEIPYYHHERWDGTGYPQRLKGEEIPLAARLFTLADVWDALCSDQPYRKGWPRHRVLTHIYQEAGKAFDPVLVSVLNKVVKKNHRSS